MNYDFSKLFYKGLDFNDPNIASIIADHYEYRRLETGTSEQIPKRGDPFNAQRVIQQIFLFLDKILVIHETGTGKSCTISFSLEQFKDALTSAVADFIIQYLMPQKVPYKKFYILVTGPILVESMEQQIICKCTAKGVYDTKALRDVSSVHMKTKILNKQFREFFEIVGYDTFTTKIKNMLEPERGENWTDKHYQDVVKESKERLTEMYSNVIFVADEIHTLTTEAENKGKYNYVKQLFHMIKNSKIMLSTATPMKNRSIEIADIMNLILPSDDQIPLPLLRDAFPPLNLEIDENEEKEKEEKKKHKRKYTEEEAKKLLLPYFRGKISYLRAMDINVDIEQFHGEEINIMEEGEFPFYVTPVIFKGKEQIEAYKKAKRKRSSKNQDVYSSERQLANVWLPTKNDKSEKLVSQERFNKLFKKRNNYVYEFKKEGNEDFEKEYLERKIPNSEEVPPFYYISPKAVECAEILSRNKGKALIFSNFRKMGVGILSICLRYIYGYEAYEGVEFFEKKEKIKSVCPTTETTERILKPGINKRKRFAILSPDNMKNIDTLDIFNSYENRYGEYIKVILVPQFGKQGINTNEVFTFINFDGHWNYTNYYQALSRVIRSDAFIWSLKEKKEQLLREDRRPEDARLTVNVYNLAGVLPDEERDEDDQENDIDISLYLTSKTKDKDIQRIMRFIKETAIDCYIHIKRNLRENDKDYSPECNYDVCKYECAVERPPDGKIKYDMYDILYSQPEVKDAKYLIQRFFEKRPSASFQTLKEELPQFREIIIIKALYEMVKNRMPLIDKFGDYVYLREDNGSFFVQREYPTDTRIAPYAMSEYVYNTPIVAEKNLVDVLIETAEEFTKKDIRKNRVNIEAMDLVQRIMYLEEIIRETIVGEKTLDNLKATNEYFSRYANRIYSFEEPEELLTEQASSTAVWRKRGRKPENLEEVKFKPLKPKNYPKYTLPSDEEGRVNEKIWIHTLLTFESTAEYERFQKGEGIYRVMKESEGYVWRDANPYETIVYNGIIQVKISEMIENLDKEKFYGYVLEDGLKIIDIENKPKEKLKQKKKGKYVKEEETGADLRTRTKGIECSKFIEVRDNIKRFEAAFSVKVKTCEDIENELRKRDLLIYLKL